MKESTPERDARRYISKQLTAQINNAQVYPDVRSVVVKALSDIKDQLRSLSSKVRRDYSLKPDEPLMFFYVKGGNALDALLERPADPPPTLFDFGRSDWDTQVVINPWIPIPAQDALHGGVEDVVIEVMRGAGLNIALEISLCAPDQSPLAGQVVDLAPVDIHVPPGQQCLVTCDNPQAFRKVYERNRAGLHLFTSEPLKGIGSSGAVPVPPIPLPPPPLPVQPPPAPPPPPGIILNDGIKPFVLYRLGYTWHARWVKDPKAPAGDDPVTPRPILMELIDVTTPRRDTVEAVTVWSDIIRNHLVIAEDAGAEERWRLPLPSMEYHLWEGLTMLCEIAAYPGWPGADKLEKRRRNVQRIHDWYRDQQNDLSTFRRVIDGISAAPVFTDDTDCMQQVDACMRVVKARMQESSSGFNDGALSVAHTQRLLHGRQWGAQRVATLLQCLNAPVASCGYSDDLALVGTLAQNPYLDVTQVPISGVDCAMIIRTDHATLRNATAANCIEALTRDHGAHMTIEDSLHSTVRATGISYERTLVIFEVPRSQPARVARAILTLTTAGPVGCPFRDNPDGSGQAIAPLLDMDNQRKVAASIIQGFVQRANLSRQHEMIRGLLPQAGQ
ncbi:hypothetical protein [Stenotrophomonas maltophilia]|uniref:hypothetical protein n=1 Tax=Stenotrophomonas maltophilia TaxID=40324 RepID=UPI0038769BC1